MDEGWAPPPRRVKLTPVQIKRARDALDELPEPIAVSARSDRPAATAPHGRKKRFFGHRPTSPAKLTGLGPLSGVRCKLPVTRHRVEVLEALRHPISIIEGETGSGKTTQVAQFLLEDAAKAGTRIRVACTQPRRISAISVAERIAQERGERVGRGGTRTRWR